MPHPSPPYLIYVLNPKHFPLCSLLWSHNYSPPTPCGCCLLLPAPDSLGSDLYLGLHSNLNLPERSSLSTLYKQHLSPFWPIPLMRQMYLLALLHWNVSVVRTRPLLCLLCDPQKSPHRWLNKYLLNKRRGKQANLSSLMVAETYRLPNREVQSHLLKGRQKSTFVWVSCLTFFPSWKTSEDSVSMAVGRSSGLWSSVRTIGWMIREA